MSKLRSLKELIVVIIASRKNHLCMNYGPQTRNQIGFSSLTVLIIVFLILFVLWELNIYVDQYMTGAPPKPPTASSSATPSGSSSTTNPSPGASPRNTPLDRDFFRWNYDGKSPDLILNIKTN
jgi:hypothetical protein